MHDYAVLGHSRVVIGRWLYVVATSLTVGITSTIATINNFTDMSAIGGLSITVGVIFWLLHLSFNKWGWWLLSFVKTYPNIKGAWAVKGQTLNENGDIKYNWEADLIIQQEYEAISVTLKTSQSNSSSDTASITKLPSQDGWRLSYGYQNKPKIEQCHQLNSHRGFCEITFDEELKTATAEYFNNNGRRTFGIMQLERKS